jgi:RimJ/RimL family protein N-acetyltransferase
MEGRGFRFVEMVYSPRLDQLDRVETVPSAPRIEPAGPGDMAAICGIAAHTFATGRFLLDGRLDRRLRSANRYRAWVQNSLEDPAHEVLKAELDGNLVGCFIVQARSDGWVYWHVTAIAPQWQGRGIGTQLWPAMLARFRDAGMRAVGTTISPHNTPVLNLHARLGFRFQPAQMTFHWLRGHGPARG